MKLKGEIRSYFVHDILSEIEQFEAEEREYRAIVAEREAERREQEKVKDADVAMVRVYRAACAEHAFLLKCEGLTLDQIGRRLGVSRERARQMIMKAARRLQRAMMRKWPRDKTRFYFEASHD